MTRALGIDYGDSRVGIALSDPMRIIAKPLDTLKNDDQLILNIQNIIKDYDVSELAVGYPLGMKGQTTQQTEKVDQFVEKLTLEIPQNISLVDERLSSVAATESLIKQGIKTGHNKSKIDSTSAAIILQEFLDSNR